MELIDIAKAAKPRCGNCNAGMKLTKGNEVRIACRLNPPTPAAFLMGVTEEQEGAPGSGGRPLIHQTMMLPLCDPEDWCRQHGFESTLTK